MSLKARIEAVLFITAQALEVQDIAEILKEEPEVVEEALLELIMDYSAREGALETTLRGSDHTWSAVP